MLIGGAAAARLGDPSLHGGAITSGEPSVWIGSNQPCDCLRDGARKGSAAVGGLSRARRLTDAERIENAIGRIEASDFGATPAGREITAQLRELQARGRLNFDPSLPPDYRGQFDAHAPNGPRISINTRYRDDPEALASRLVHEGTHAADQGRFPWQYGGSIDGEVLARRNQLDLYEEQRAAGWRDPEHELDVQRAAHRRDVRAGGNDDEHLRELIRATERDLPEMRSRRPAASAGGGP